MAVIPRAICTVDWIIRQMPTGKQHYAVANIDSAITIAGSIEFDEPQQQID
jgi:hypothetical protein